MRILEDRAERNWARRRDGQSEDSLDPWEPSVSLGATVSAALTLVMQYCCRPSRHNWVQRFDVASVIPIAYENGWAHTLWGYSRPSLSPWSWSLPSSNLRYRKTPSAAFDSLGPMEVPVRVYLLV